MNRSYSINATILIGGSYNTTTFTLGLILPNGTQELIPLVTSNQMKSMTLSSTKLGFKVYDTTTNLMNMWNGSGWQVINDATASSLAINTSTGQSLVDVSPSVPPIAGQVLTATSPTSATWQNSTGGGGSSTQFVHSQIVPSATWYIVHDLDKYPTVVVVDSSGNLFMGDIDYNSAMALTITFTSVFGGTAYLT